MGDRPRRSECSVDVWEERDRLHITIHDDVTNENVADWWDDDARQMFEDGFFETDFSFGTLKYGRKFEASVLEYAQSVGIIE